jgi:poly(hydroxyalkanoate) depolymerase family esterase
VWCRALSVRSASARAAVAAVGVLAVVAAQAEASSSWHTYTNAAGSRQYLLELPDGLPHHPPLVVYLHGCSQSAADVAVGTRWSALADTERFVVAYPEEPNGGCWDWPHRANQHRGAGQPSIIAGITRRVIRATGADRRRVYILGASAGAYMAGIMGATYPDLYAAIGVLAGGPYALGFDSGPGAAGQSAPGADASGMDAYREMGPRAHEMPVFVTQGTADPVNPFGAAVAAVQQWLGTNDLIDDGDLDGSVARTPAGTDNAGVDPAAPPQPGSGDNCLSHQTMPCPGGVAGFQHSYPYTVTHYADASGAPLIDFWIIHGETHAYSGGDPRGSYTDPLGPDITAGAWAFFAAHPRPAPR